jgi:hypothetical protein
VTADPVFTSAARFFAALTRDIPSAGWTGPGLGDWNMRALVGHTSRSLTTVSTYLQTTADREDVETPQDYYRRIRDASWIATPAEIVERGRQAGRDLGADPAATVAVLAARALADVERVENPLMTVIGGLGIRLHTYLPTRVFELAVHGLDIARAAAIDAEPPVEVLDAATALAARTAVALGRGPAVLAALTGRDMLPAGFSIV